MSLGEFDTAVRYGLRLLVLVYNDQAYGAEMHFLRMLSIDDTDRGSPSPHSTKWRGQSVPMDTAFARRRRSSRSCHCSETLRGPLLLDCHVSQNVRASWLAEAFERGAH